MENKALLSVLMPSLNVAPYIRQCIESVLGQTEKNIEILCIDAGSTDGTLEILREYAERDPRVQVIVSDQKSYGHQMNLGLDAASGEYIGIVETDDWIEQDAFTSLYEEAKKNDADIVRANYYWHYTNKQPSDKPFENLANCPYDTVFSPLDITAALAVAPAIWSGIYRRSLITENGIRFNETPGASYQDTSFYLMVCASAKRMYHVNRYFLHYRRDNENSSVNNGGKVYCICDEMRHFEKFLCSHPAEEEKLRKVYPAIKLDKYLWNYRRLAPQFQWDFLTRIREEFLAYQERGLLESAYFPKSNWEVLLKILTSPVQYFKETCKLYVTRPVGSQLPQPELLRQATSPTPLLSVLIPAYNSQDCLSAAVESVLGQTLKNVELVCVDDGSSDDTLALLLRYADKDDRITVLHQTNMGQATARNVGLAYVRGKYVQFLDSDDSLREDAAEYLVSHAEDMDLDVLYFDGVSVFETEQLEANNAFYATAYEFPLDLSSAVTGPEFFCLSMEAKKYKASSCMALYRKAYLDETDLRFIDGIIHEDNYFSLKCILNAKRVWHTQEKFYQRTVRAGSTMTMEKSFFHLYGYLVTLQKTLELMPQFQYEERLDTNLASIFAGLLYHVRFNYKKLNDKNAALARLSPVEKHVLNMVLEPIKKDEYSIRLSKIKQSFSYRLGSTLTWPVRKVRGGVRCAQEHGVEYTIRRALGLKNPPPARLPHHRAYRNVVVSVIIPVYNAAPYLDDCIGSLIRQSLKPIEIICVDDGSTDNSVEILEKYQKIDKRIIILKQKNSGAGIARNTGMKIARGKYLSILDADDFFAPQMLEKAYNAAEANHAEITMFRSDWYNHEKKTSYKVRDMQPSYFPDKKVFSVADMEMNFYYAIQGWAWDKLFLKSFVEEWGLQFQGTKMYNDMYFTYSALSVAKRITYLEDALLFRRINRPGAITKSVQKNWSSVFTALQGVKTFLEESGNYEKYKKHFTTYALYIILYTYDKVEWQEKVKMRDYFRSHAKDDLGLDLWNADCFEKPDELERGLRCFYEQELAAKD